jgi:hypothetical protein
MIMIGVILFLYGANYYNATIGWIGFYLILGGFFAGISLKIYRNVRKK